MDQVEKIGKKFSYNISEIVFNVEINESLEEIISKINDSIKEIGFENSEYYSKQILQTMED